MAFFALGAALAAILFAAIVLTVGTFVVAAGRRLRTGGSRGRIARPPAAGARVRPRR